MATTEDSQESIEHFNWLMSTNRYETSCMNCCQGCYTGQCSAMKKLRDIHCGRVTLGNFYCNLYRNKIARQVGRNVAQCNSL